MMRSSAVVAFHWRTVILRATAHLPLITQKGGMFNIFVDYRVATIDESSGGNQKQHGPYHSGIITRVLNSFSDHVRLKRSMTLMRQAAQWGEVLVLRWSGRFWPLIKISFIWPWKFWEDHFGGGSLKTSNLIALNPTLVDDLVGTGVCISKASVSDGALGVHYYRIWQSHQ